MQQSAHFPSDFGEHSTGSSPLCHFLATYWIVVSTFLLCGIMVCVGFYFILLCPACWMYSTITRMALLNSFLGPFFFPFIPPFFWWIELGFYCHGLWLCLEGQFGSCHQLLPATMISLFIRMAFGMVLAMVDLLPSFSGFCCGNMHHIQMVYCCLLELLASSSIFPCMAGSASFGLSMCHFEGIPFLSFLLQPHVVDQSTFLPFKK